jgi:hypothetical protein
MAEEDNKTEQDEVKETVKSMIEALNALPAAVNKSVQEGMKTALTEFNQSGNSKQEEEEEEHTSALSEDELDKMSRQDLVRHITDTMGQELKKILKPIDERISDTRNETERERLSRELAQVRAAHPEFDQFKEEVSESVRQNPHLSIEDHLVLAKSKNPEKVQMIEKEKAEKEEKEKTSNVRPFGGLTPTSGVKSEKSDKMTSSDAANAAWEEAMAEVITEDVG